MQQNTSKNTQTIDDKLKFYDTLGSYTPTADKEFVQKYDKGIIKKNDEQKTSK